MVVVTVDREQRQKVCGDCGEKIEGPFLALPVLGIVLCPQCGSTVGRRLQEDAEEAFEISLRDILGQRDRA